MNNKKNDFLNGDEGRGRWTQDNKTKKKKKRNGSQIYDGPKYNAKTMLRYGYNAKGNEIWKDAIDIEDDIDLFEHERGRPTTSIEKTGMWQKQKIKTKNENQKLA